MELAKNEKKVLVLLLDNGRISNVEMAEKIGVTSQAIGLIRKKLENKGIIKKYICMLDYEKMGFGLFVVVKVKDVNENINSNNIIESLKSIPEVTFLCKIPGLDIYAGLYVFKNSNEIDKHFKIFRKRFSRCFEIVEMYSFSTSNLLKCDSSALFKTVLE